MLLLSMFFAAALPDVVLFFPSPFDKDGWGLRIHRLSRLGPFIESERIDQVRFRVTLINFSKQSRESIPLDFRGTEYGLNMRIFPPKGVQFPPLTSGDPTVEMKLPPNIKLQPFEFTTVEMNFKRFGYIRLLAKGGQYRVELILSRALDEQTSVNLKSPPIELEAIDLTQQDILDTYTIKQTGKLLKRPIEDRGYSVIEQTKIGEKTWLFYRKFLPSRFGGTAEYATRIAEIPGKVEMKVTGEEGDNFGPLAITYADKKSPSGTVTITIHANGGSPWTDDDQTSYDIDHNIAPPPRSKP